MPSKRPIRVLVIDDEPEICNTVQTLLADQGYHVRTCTEAQPALTAVAEGQFDVALVDVMLPGLQGTEVIRQIRRSDPKVGCIAMTGYPGLDTAAACMQQGARDYVVKPFESRQLIDAVERLAHDLGLIYNNEAELNRLIGQRIRQERLAQNMTLRALSERATITTSQLSQVELGKNGVSVWALARISGALGKPIAELLHGL
jgi:DNA-binding NtrC family response regulator